MKTLEATPLNNGSDPTAGEGGAREDCSHLADASAGRRGDHERAILLAMRYAKSNFRGHLTVSDMAHAAMYSRYHFTRIFRQLTAMSPGEFLTAIRIAEAKRLLSETDLTVADVCTRVGYQSLGTFTARFAEVVGMPPGRFRQTTRLALEAPSRSRSACGYGRSA